MFLKRPKQFDLTIEPMADYRQVLAAFSLAALKTKPTTFHRVERTEYIRAVESFLATGGIRCLWGEQSVTIDPSERTPFDCLAKKIEYELFKYALVLSATTSGSKLALISDLDNTVQMIILALQRMGAVLEFVKGKPNRMVVDQPIKKAVRYHLGKETVKIVPQLVLAMAAVQGGGEINDLVGESRFDDLFSEFIPGFRRFNFAADEPEDELERRLRKRTQQAGEYHSKITVEGGIKDEEVEITLRADSEFAAYVAAAAMQHPKGRLILKGFDAEDLSRTPLAQLRRMGAEFRPWSEGQSKGFSVMHSDLKSRTFTYDQLHSFPDSVGALALAGTRSDGTSVIRTARYSTKREEEHRRKLSKVIEKLGVKVGQVPDGIVLEGKRELSGEKIETGVDPLSVLTAVAATLGPVDQVEIDDVKAAQARWGESFQKLLAILQ